MNAQTRFSVMSKRKDVSPLRYRRTSSQHLNSEPETCLPDRSFVRVSAAYLHSNKACDIADIQC